MKNTCKDLESWLTVTCDVISEGADEVLSTLYSYALTIETPPTYFVKESYMSYFKVLILPSAII